MLISETLIDMQRDDSYSQLQILALLRWKMELFLTSTKIFIHSMMLRKLFSQETSIIFDFSYSHIPRTSGVFYVLSRKLDSSLSSFTYAFKNIFIENEYHYSGGVFSFISESDEEDGNSLF
jgi:hypothetical protein